MPPQGQPMLPPIDADAQPIRLPQVQIQPSQYQPEQQQTSQRGALQHQQARLMSEGRQIPHIPRALPKPQATVFCNRSKHPHPRPHKTTSRAATSPTCVASTGPTPQKGARARSQPRSQHKSATAWHAASYNVSSLSPNSRQALRPPRACTPLPTTCRNCLHGSTWRSVSQTIAFTQARRPTLTRRLTPTRRQTCLRVQTHHSTTKLPAERL